eukprot:TRINITY_DN17164_c0_g1_i1.p2 TRINITY_DN17164_c0_g1~~TRINITY_DN17164_c0_g1_i1.p2  ORF type:complete len:60 (+),score=11.03 TRINITY_DN17164_c0_g1_i1:193-372(+)
MPTFSSLFVLLLIVFYIYAVIGMTLFSGKFDEATPEGPPQSNFEDLSKLITDAVSVSCG